MCHSLDFVQHYGHQASPHAAFSRFPPLVLTTAEEALNTIEYTYNGGPESLNDGPNMPEKSLERTKKLWKRTVYAEYRRAQEFVTAEEIREDGRGGG